MTILSRQGLSLHISDPLIKSGRSGLSQRLTSRATYSHQIRRVGGYDSASIRMDETENKLDDWIANGIGKHFEAFSAGLEKFFEGFVNKVSIVYGENKIDIGPLIRVSNQNKVTFSTINSSVSPPMVGGRDTTDFANNTTSQTKFGIWQKIISDSGNTTTGAEQLRDMFVSDPSRAFPASSDNFTLLAGGGASVVLSILGYWHWFKAYLYESSVTGDIDLSQKIINVINASPNNIFSADFSKITANTTQVEAQTERPTKADDIIKKLNSQGDASFNSYQVGVYNDRRLVYKPVVNEVKYHKRRGQLITDKFGGTVYPWSVRPSYWLLKTDALVGKKSPVSDDTLGNDNRSQLIESVRYTSPFKLSTTGNKLGDIDIVLQRSGLGGIG